MRNNVFNFISKRKSEILIGLGISGLICSGILAVKQTPKAIVLLGRKKEELELNDDEKLPAGEIVKTIWKLYLPSVVLAGGSTLSIIMAQRINNKKTAALATIASLSETALIEYKDKVIEAFGEKKNEKIEDAMVQQKVIDNPATTIILTGNGETLCMDSISNQYFKSNPEKIKKAVNDLNARMRDEMYISLTDFYYEIGIPQTAISDFLLWRMEDGYIDIRLSSALDENNYPCLVILYDRLPRYY